MPLEIVHDVPCNLEYVRKYRSGDHYDMTVMFKVMTKDFDCSRIFEARLFDWVVGIKHQAHRSDIADALSVKPI